MLLKRRKIVLFAFMFLNSQLGYSQEFTLKQALDYALEHNPSIIIAKNNVEKAKLNFKDTQRLLDLNVSFQFGYSPLTNREGMGFSISQNIDKLFGMNNKEKHLAGFDLNTVEQELFVTSQNVIKEVTQAFNNLESSKKLLKLKEEARNDAQKSLELANEKFNMGTISFDEILAKKQQARLSGFEFQETENKVKQAALEFYQVIGYKSLK